MFDHLLENGDMLGITIHNEVNQTDKPIGFSFRRKDQILSDVIWSVFDKVSQSNSRFNASDTLTVVAHSVKMPIGFGVIKHKGITFANMVHLKRSIIEVSAEENCLAHALIIAIARLNNDPNYSSYWRGNKIRPLVKELLDASVIDLKNGAGSRN